MDDRGLASVCGGDHARPELRIVLLGGRSSGKSSAGNSILGKEVFPAGARTAACAWGRRGETGGRRVAVVDTPGWWCDFYARDTPELLKREMARGVATLCAPGPHAVLLAVKASSGFTERRRRALEEHLGLFGEAVWEHVVVLFTSADSLGDTTIHQHLEAGGKALRWLLEKCGNRYQMLSNRSPATVAQVTELLAKVDKMVTVNGGRYYEMDSRALWEVEERRKEEKERAEQRLAEVWKQRTLLSGRVRRLSELRIVLLGARRSGKSSAGNCILGRREFPVGPRTASCAVGRGRAAGRRVAVVDTPGWWANYLAEESPELDRSEVRRSALLCPPGPHGLLLAVRADRAFGETHRRALAGHMELLGAGAWSRAAVLFTFGDWLGGKSVEEHVEAEGGALRWLVEKCGNRYHVLDGGNGVDVDARVARLLEGIEETAAANGGSHFEPGEASREEERWRKAAEERAKERMNRVEEKRRAIRSLFPGGVPTLSDMTLVLLGSVCAGKSSAGNTILGSEEFEAGQVTDSWQKRQGRTCGRAVTVVDTPGWRVGRSEVGERREIPGGIPPPWSSLRPDALLLAVNGSSSFTEAHRRAAEERMESLGGEEVWGVALVLFTNGDWLGGASVEQRVEADGGALRWLVEKCGNRYHVLDNKSRGDRRQVSELLEKIEEMEAFREQRREQEKTKLPLQQLEMTEETEVAREQRREQEKTKLPVQQVEEELEEDPQSSACGFIGHHCCMTKRGGSAVMSEERSALRLHVLPLLSLLLQSTARSQGELNIPCREWLGSPPHRSRPPLLIDRHVKEDAGQWLVKADAPDPSYGSQPQNLLLAMPADRLSRGPPERTGEVSGKTRTGHEAVLPSCAEPPKEETVQSGGTDTPEGHGGKSTIGELESFIDDYFEAVRTGAVDLRAPTETHHYSNSTRSLQHSPSQPPMRDEGELIELDYRSQSSTDQILWKLSVLEEMQEGLMEMDHALRLSRQVIQELRKNYEEAKASGKQLNGGEPWESASGNGGM